MGIGMRPRPGLLLLGVLLAGGSWPGWSGATHYPAGALCYDCHAVSATKMIQGTHLLKYDERAVALGMGPTTPTVRCLYCHAAQSVSLSGAARAEMLPVAAHFSSDSLSRHPADFESTFGDDGGASFDCLDCHSGLDAGVAAGGGTVHGIDAGAADVDLLASLRGSPATVDALCSDADCHGTAPQSFGSHVPAAAHDFGTGISSIGITLNDGATPAGCTACHGAHRSPDRPALLVLENRDRTALADGSHPRVRLGDCDVCHTQDENGSADDNFALHGHGAFEIGCATCHGSSHAFDGSDRLRPQLAEDTGSTSSVSSESLHSNCRHCHELHAGHTFADVGPHPAGQASCIDCHDQHGTEVADGTAVNDTMVRLDILGEAVRLPVSEYTYDGDWYLESSDQGVCDNSACHNTLVAGLASDHGADSAGAVSPADLADCASSSGCHVSHDAAPFAAAIDCGGCHGDPVANTRWPDGVRNNSQQAYAWADDAGAHAVHVAALVTGNGACAVCHPGNPPRGHYGDGLTGAEQAEVTRMDVDGDGTPDAWTHAEGAAVSRGTPVTFRTITGASDPDAYYSVPERRCYNVDCHAGAPTPSWYYQPDTAAPQWSSSSGIVATDLGQGGTLEVTWNAAVDAYPSEPVRYDLYMSTTDSAVAVFSGPPILTGLAGTSVIIPNLVNGTNHYFGVRAKDSWPAPNETTNMDYSGGAAPTGTDPGEPTNRVFYLRRSTGLSLTGIGTTNITEGCNSFDAGNDVANQTTPPPVALGVLGDAVSCPTASRQSAIGATIAGWTGERWFAGFFTDPSVNGGRGYSTPTTVTGSSTGNVFGFKADSLGGPHFVQVYLVALDSSGTVVDGLDTFVRYGGLPIGSTTSTRADLDLSSLQVVVPPGGRLAVYVSYFDANSATNDHQMAIEYYDSNSGDYYVQMSVVEDRDDPFAPVWPSGDSGIRVDDPQSGGELLISWDTATEAGLPASPPVTYDLYRSTVSAADAWNNLHRAGLGATSYTDRDLTNGLTYYYGVRAKDDAATPNATANSDTASGVPTVGAIGCNICHSSPPDSGPNAGSHRRHANGDDDYSECDRCHPGASSYANDHQDGVAQLGFEGTAYAAQYGVPAPDGVTYSDGSADFYVDADGYAGLGAGAGDGEDDGTCSNTLCHGTATPVWGSVGSVTCADCHGAPGGETPEAPTVTAASPHVDADGSGGAWNAGDCSGCHAGHYQGVRIPLPPASWDNNNGGTNLDMQARLGLAYGTGGVHLGGSAVAAAISGRFTEAEMCWGCHDAVGVSEWGYNTKTHPGAYPVVELATQGDGTAPSQNYGWIYASAAHTTKISDWTAGRWRSEYDPLLFRRITSIHSVSFDPAGQVSSVAENVTGSGAVDRTSPALEDRSRIRCSYCHDVHDTLGPDGKPFLRGTWWGNPYPGEIPPRPGYTYTTRLVNSSSAVFTPRGVSTSRDPGGYFIDQNSGNPTASNGTGVGGGWTAQDSAGLCLLCHGADIDNMDYYTGSTLWRFAPPNNGHSNSTVGGTGSAKSDLFSATRGGTWGFTMGMQSLTGTRDRGFCFDPCLPDHPQCTRLCGTQANVANSGWYDGDYANWYGSGTIGGMTGAGTKAHQFSCSKCHTPHASGLPALLTHNCVDPSLGNWSVLSGTNPVHGWRPQSSNCHRKTTVSDGWHRLEPGQ